MVVSFFLSLFMNLFPEGGRVSKSDYLLDCVKSFFLRNISALF